MSKDFENEIKDSILNDKIFFVYKKYKSLIISILSLLILIIVFYFANEVREKNKHAGEFENYSKALDNLNQKNLKEAEIIFKELINSDNNSIILLSLNRLLDDKISTKAQMLQYLDTVLKKNKLKKEYINLLKIKKVIIIFDDVDNDKIIPLLDISNKNNFLQKINIELLNNLNARKNLKENQNK